MAHGFHCTADSYLAGQEIYPLHIRINYRFLDLLAEHFLPQIEREAVNKFGFQLLRCANVYRVSRHEV
jgi:hypothetical protein